MDYEVACDRLCEDISQLLLEEPVRPSLRATYAAARATQDLAAAFHHAAGRSEDPLWSVAIVSLGRFLDFFDAPRAGKSSAMRELSRFVDENGDALRFAGLKVAS